MKPTTHNRHTNRYVTNNKVLLYLYILSIILCEVYIRILQTLGARFRKVRGHSCFDTRTAFRHNSCWKVTRRNKGPFRGICERNARTVPKHRLCVLTSRWVYTYTFDMGRAVVDQSIKENGEKKIYKIYHVLFIVGWWIQRKKLVFIFFCTKYFDQTTYLSSNLSRQRIYNTHNTPLPTRW